MRTSDSPARQRNFNASFRWHRRTAGGTAFALSPEPFQGILRPSLPYLLWSNCIIVSCGNRPRARTLHCCHLMLIC
ncbi:hypothetical protein BDL97_14G041100 [Sphagnum fallax]|nr:hypothetical protein BDL97_14G041100 [Sphagnum fallax]